MFAIRRFGLAALLCLGVLPATSAAAQLRGGPWSVGLTAALTGFHGAAVDDAEESEFTIRPSQGIAVGIGVTRQLGPWALSLGMSYLPTHVEAMSSEVAVRERTMSLDRLRLAFSVGRRVARVGTGRLEARGSGVLDHWSVAGEDGRIVAGGEVALAMQLPVGRVTVENTVGVGWTEAPFLASELPAGYRRVALRAVTAGVGVGW